MITSRWYAQHKAAHTAGLASPQRFRLTGDGLVTERIIASGPLNGGPIGPELAPARYRDWRGQAISSTETPDDTTHEPRAAQ